MCSFSSCPFDWLAYASYAPGCKDIAACKEKLPVRFFSDVRSCTRGLPNHVRQWNPLAVLAPGYPGIRIPGAGCPGTWTPGHLSPGVRVPGLPGFLSIQAFGCLDIPGIWIPR